MKKIYYFFLVLTIGVATAVMVTAFNNPVGNPTTGGGIIGVGSGAPASSLYIDSTGKVGIGTTGPTNKLQVKGDVIRFERQNTALDTLDFNMMSDTIPRVITNGHLGFIVGTGKSYRFDVGAGTEVMRIDAAGNVGIGTNVPGVSLDVNGGVRAGSNTVVAVCGLGQAAGEGTQRYNYTTHAMEYCNGSGWIKPGGDTALIGNNGYTKLPSGLIIQWGSVSAVALPANNGGTFGTITFPISFPNSVFSVVPTLVGNYPGPSEWQDHSVKVGNITTSNFVIWAAAPNNGGYAYTYTAQWIAIGY